MVSANMPKSVKSYHSITFPMTPAAPGNNNSNNNNMLICDDSSENKNTIAGEIGRVISVRQWYLGEADQIAPPWPKLSHNRRFESHNIL